MVNVVNFYKALPRGEAPAPQKASGVIGWYKAKYFDKGSSTPLLHLILAGFIFGYANDYHFHLSHEHEH